MNEADAIHRCEVLDIVARYFPDGAAAAEYMKLCEKKRGKAAADKLRDDVREEWKKRRVEMLGQA